MKPFSDSLRQIRHGACEDELAEKLGELVRAVNETGRQGTLTLQLKVKQMRGNSALEITDVIKTSVPEPEKESSLFFSDDEGNLLRDDPRQRKMNLEPVKSEAKPVEEVSANG